MKPRAPGPSRGGKNRVSLEEIAYRRLKQDILTCVLRPGEMVNVVGLAEQMELGRTPVLQAMARLQYDRLVQVIPRKGIFVRPVSIDEYLDLLDTRLLLEAEAAGLAAERRTAGELDEMRRLVEEISQAHDAQALRPLFLGDRDLHLLIARASGNAVLAELIPPIFDRAFRIWFTLNGDRRRIPRPIHDDHRRLLSAVERQDPIEARAIMREHILVARAKIIGAADRAHGPQSRSAILPDGQR